jgi:hypothetical protein
VGGVRKLKKCRNQSGGKNKEKLTKVGSLPLIKFVKKQNEYSLFSFS